MRYLRYLLFGFGAALLTLGLAATITAVYFRESLARLVMQQVEARTGFQVLSTYVQVEFFPRLTVQLHHAEVLDHGRSLGRSEDLQLSFSYTFLVWRTGLPLYRIVLDRPEFHLPSSAGNSFPPRLDDAATELLQRSLATLSHITSHLDVIAATVLRADNQPLLKDTNVTAYKRLLSGTRWRVNFNSTWVGTPLKDTHFSGTVNLNANEVEPTAPIAQGELWFWGISLDGLPLLRGLETRGQLQADLSLTLRDDATAIGNVAIKITAAGLAGQSLVAATPPGDLNFDATLNYSPDRLALQKIELWRGRQIILAGDGSIEKPYNPNPTLALSLGGVTLNASQLQEAISSLRQPPGWLPKYAAQLRSGEIRVNQVALDSTLDDLKSASPLLAKRLNVDATLEGVSFSLPSDLQLPPVERLEATLLMRQNVLTIGQASAVMGNSHLTRLDARIDFSRSLVNPSYTTDIDGDIDLGSLYSRSTKLSEMIPASIRGQLRGIDGSAGFDLQAQGKISAARWEPPPEYELTAEPHHLEVGLKIGGPDFALVAGTVQLTPGKIVLDHLTATPPAGKVIANGSLSLTKPTPTLAEMRLRIEQLPAEQWLPLVIDPGDLAAQGRLTGNLTVASDAVQTGRYRVDGSLRLEPGKILFGFLRSPITTQRATLKLANGGAELLLLGSTLEGSRLDLTLGVADLRDPRMRIDAWAENLDLEAMTFIRMPWTPKSSSIFFGKSHAFGHVEALHSKLLRLPIDSLKFDFTRDGGAWHVFNCGARISNGAIAMELIGRDPDDWVQIKSRLTDADLGPLVTWPAISGHRR